MLWLALTTQHVCGVGSPMKKKNEPLPPGESGWCKSDQDSIPEGEVIIRGEGGGGWSDRASTINLTQKPATDSRRRKKHNIGQFFTAYHYLES